MNPSIQSKTFIISILAFILAACNNQNTPTKTEEKTTSKISKAYTDVATDCNPIDLTNWKHATKDIFIEQKINIDKVELCQGGKYPIFFTKSFPYDPNSNQTNDYFNNLIGDLTKANGFWPFMLISIEDNVIFKVAKGEDKKISSIILAYIEEEEAERKPQTVSKSEPKVLTDKESLHKVEEKMKALKFHQYDGTKCVEASLNTYIKSLDTLQKRYKIIDKEKIGDVVMDAVIERYDDYGNIEVQGRFIRGKEACEIVYSQLKEEAKNARNSRNKEIDSKYK